MSTGLMIHTAAALVVLMAVAQAGGTLLDLWREPRFLKPVDKPLLNRLRKTTAAVAPGGRDYWAMVLGLSLGHATGLVLFAFLIELAASPFMAWLRPALIGAGALYTTIAWKFWSNRPAWAFALATGLLAWAWFGPS